MSFLRRFLERHIPSALRLSFFKGSSDAANVDATKGGVYTINIENLMQPDTLKFIIPISKRQELEKQRKSYTRKQIFWTTDWYQNAEGKSVEIRYADNIKDAETLAQRFAAESVLGFDMEWKFIFGKRLPGLKENVSLIQLARDGEVGLFHIARHEGTTVPELFAPSLLKIIQSTSIVKTGVSIHSADARQLRTYAGIEARGLFELSHLYRLLDRAADPDGKSTKHPKGMVSLSKQVQAHLGFPLAKGAVRTSDWTQPLTEAQRSYAATDAYAGLVLYHTMDAKRRNLKSVPPLPAYVDISRMRQQVADIIEAENEQQQTTAKECETKEQTDDIDSDSSDDAFEPAPNDREPTVQPPEKPAFRMPPAWSPPQSQETEKENVQPEQQQSSSNVSFSASMTTTATANEARPQSNKRKRELREISGNARQPSKRTLSSKEIHGAPECKPSNPLLSALQALRRRLLADPTVVLPPFVTETTLQGFANQLPASVPELCRIPGAVALMQICRANNVDLLAFVRRHDAI